MTAERGPLIPYEVIWNTGHVETINAHQVILPMSPLFGEVAAPRRVMFHGEIGGHWQLLLEAAADDIRSIRNTAATEVPS